MKNNSNYDDVALLSVTKAAQIMKVGKARIYGFISSKKLKAIDLNGVIRIPYFEIKKCLENLYVNATYTDAPVDNTITRKTIITDPKHIMKNIKKSREIK
jgi:hypothetical protein